MSSPIARGGLRSGLERRIAALEAKSPCAGFAGYSTATAVVFTSSGQPSSAAARSSAVRNAAAGFVHIAMQKMVSELKAGARPHAQ